MEREVKAPLAQLRANLLDGLHNFPSAIASSPPLTSEPSPLQSDSLFITDPAYGFELPHRFWDGVRERAGLRDQSSFYHRYQCAGRV